MEDWKTRNDGNSENSAIYGVFDENSDGWKTGRQGTMKTAKIAQFTGFSMKTAMDGRLEDKER